MAYIKWSQPIHTFFGWDPILVGHFSQKNLSGNSHNKPHFLPTIKLHPLKTLTRGPPPMYWLGTSRWWSVPLCMLHSIWICFFLAFTPFLLSPCLFDSIVRANWCLSFMAWRMCELSGSYFLPFTPSWIGYCLGKSLHFPTKPVLFFLHNRGPFGH